MKTQQTKFDMLIAAVLILMLSVSHSLAQVLTPAQDWILKHSKANPDTPPFHRPRPQTPVQGTSATVPSAGSTSASSSFSTYQPPAPPQTPEQLAAVRELQRKMPQLAADANSGFPTQAYLVGRMYEAGLQGPQQHPDMKRALDLYRTANEHGNVNARYRLGYLMTCGISADPITNPLATRAMGQRFMRAAVMGGV